MGLPPYKRYGVHDVRKRLKSPLLDQYLERTRRFDDDEAAEIAREIQAKDDAGRAKFGPVWVGDPLDDLLDENRDAVNYIKEARRQGLLSSAEARALECLQLASIGAVREIQGKKIDPKG